MMSLPVPLRSLQENKRPVTPLTNVVTPISSDGLGRLKKGLKSMRFDFSGPTAANSLIENTQDFQAHDKLKEVLERLTDKDICDLKKSLRGLGYVSEKDPSEYYCYFICIMLFLFLLVPTAIIALQANLNKRYTTGELVLLYFGVIFCYLLVGILLALFFICKFRRFNSSAKAYNYKVLLKAIALHHQVGWSPVQVDSIPEIEMNSIYIRCQI